MEISHTIEYTIPEGRIREICDIRVFFLFSMLTICYFLVAFLNVADISLVFFCFSLETAHFTFPIIIVFTDNVFLDVALKSECHLFVRSLKVTYVTRNLTVSF